MSSEKALAALRSLDVLIRRASDEDQMRHVSEIKRQADKYRAFFKEGYAGKAGTRKASVDAKQLAMGIKVEMEHTNNKDIATKIALDHLAESPNSRYYSVLDQLELFTQALSSMPGKEQDAWLEKLAAFVNTCTGGPDQ